MPISSGAANDMGRNDFNINSSQSAQDNFNSVAQQLEAALDAQDASVRTLMSQYEADGVSEQHRGNEKKWFDAGQEVRNIINAIRGSLAESDGFAQGALKTASAATDI